MENLTAEEIKKIVKEEHRKYAREWRKKNPEKVKAAQERFWLKKHREAEQKAKEA